MDAGKEAVPKRAGRPDLCAGGVRYYEADGHKSEAERLFEETYTDYAGSGVMQYIAGIILALVRGGILSEAEANAYTSLIQSYRG